MNTFLPYPDFARSAACLDWRRLGKQRVEAMQLMHGSWPNHPASKMWRGYGQALCRYGVAMCDEWLRRGYRDSIREEFLFAEITWFAGEPLDPPWLGDDRVHSSHRANLLRKDFEHYSQFGWSEHPQEGYYWPGASR